MLQSEFFLTIQKNPPKDEQSANARFLIRGGYVQKLMAGVYTLLPLGLKTVRNIEKIVREEMNAIGSQELLMPALQPKELWDETGRWESLKGSMYQFEDSSKKPVGLGFTHEENVLQIAREHISSYKDLPLSVYQIQRKFRDEPRPKSGLLRGRDFFMKDMYSLHTSQEELDDFYTTTATEAYKKVFSRMGLEVVYTEAAGGVFTDKHTHEFQVLAENGEDTIYHCRRCNFSENKEIAKVKEGDTCPGCGGTVMESRAIEVGNIFRFDDTMSQKMNVLYTDKNGKKQQMFLGSYGIGITRLLGTIVEVRHSAEASIRWPEEVTPFTVHLLALPGGESDAEKLYGNLVEKGVSVLYDDRANVSAGVKFADADFVGAPKRAIVGGKTPEGEVEVNGKKVSQKSFLESC